MATDVLGEHPISAEFKMVMIFLAATAGSTWAAKHFNWNWDLFLIIVAFVAALLTFQSLVRLAGYWLRGYGRVYRQAEIAVAHGSIVPSYVGRDAECSSIVVVDETNKKLFINGGLFAFADIKSVGTRSSTEVVADAYQARTTTTPWIEFHLRAGANPLKRVYFDSVAARDNFYARLCNSMNLS